MKRRNFLQIIPVVAVAPQLLTRLSGKRVLIPLGQSPMTPRVVSIRAVAVTWSNGSQSFYKVIESQPDGKPWTIDDLNKAEFGAYENHF